MNDTLIHEGTPQPYINQPIGSGRYRRGTGDNPNQHDFSLSARKSKLTKEGMKEIDIAHALGFNSTTELRKAITIEKNKRQEEKTARARFLLSQGGADGRGLGWTAVAREMGEKSESTVRSWFKETAQKHRERSTNLLNMLREQALKKRYIDVGQGTAMRIGVSDNMLASAVTRLVEDEGFHQEKIHVEQMGTGHQTSMKILCAPDVTFKELNANRSNIKLIDDYTENLGRSFANLEPPVSIDPKRVYIRYAEDGGKDKDGVMEFRRGVPDISLNNADYAQVRIAVNNTHFLKGVAVYGDDKDIPKGYDIVFNTNKSKDVPMMGPDTNSVLKPLKNDPQNPFKATIKAEEDLVLAQRHYVDPKTGERKLSPVNIVNEQGDWDRWSKTLSAQFLSKQAVPLAKAQLNALYNDQKIEFEKLKQLTNPIVKRNLLDALAEDCDSKAVYLKAAPLPRQASKLILPAPEIKPNEIVAPTYNDGEHVVLIRFPHGGKFEIPELVVNNKGNQKALKMIGNGGDAVAIHPSSAARLSGADFDGDTVLVIPVNNRVKIDTINPDTNDSLKTLKDFDPGIYARQPGEKFKRMDKTLKGYKMGETTNLINDMTLLGATLDEITRAVKHSMVVIDAEKHDLNWQQSYKDFKIAELQKEYQGRVGGQASTLISRARKKVTIDDRKEGGSGFYPSQMTPEERAAYDAGEKVYRNSGATTPKKTKEGDWEQVPKKVERKWLEVEDDAYKLTSGGSEENPGTKIEGVYAEHSNRMKALANEVRKEARAVKNGRVSTSAKAAYAEEIKSLDEKYNKVMTNKPLERQANLIANEQLKAWKKANEGDYDKDDLKKIRGQLQNGARYRVGKETYNPTFTAKEWEAIQARAYAPARAEKLIAAAKKEHVRELAMPSKKMTITPAIKRQIKALSNKSGYTQKEIANYLNISVSTVTKVLNGTY